MTQLTLCPSPPPVLSLCPHCGYNFTADTIVQRGPWTIDPRNGVYYNQSVVTRRFTWTTILSTLAMLNGEWITTEALLNRTSTTTLSLRR